MSDDEWWLDTEAKWKNIMDRFEDSNRLDFSMIWRQCGFCEHFGIEDPSDSDLAEYGEGKAICVKCPAFDENVCSNAIAGQRTVIGHLLTYTEQRSGINTGEDVKAARKLLKTVWDFIQKHKPEEARRG